MRIKKILKQGLKFIFGKRSIQLTAQITQLGPSELLKGRAALITGGTSDMLLPMPCLGLVPLPL